MPMKPYSVTIKHISPPRAGEDAVEVGVFEAPKIEDALKAANEVAREKQFSGTLHAVAI